MGSKAPMTLNGKLAKGYFKVERWRNGTATDSSEQTTSKMDKYQLLFDLTQYFNWRIRTRQLNNQSTLHRGAEKIVIDWDNKTLIAAGARLREAEIKNIEGNEFKILM